MLCFSLGNILFGHSESYLESFWNAILKEQFEYFVKKLQNDLYAISNANPSKKVFSRV